MAWDGMAWHGMVEVFVVAHMCSSTQCLFALCVRLSYLIGQAHTISMWPGKLTRLQQSPLALMLCRCYCCFAVVVVFISQFEIAFAININRIFLRKCSSALDERVCVCVLCSACPLDLSKLKLTKIEVKRIDCHNI